MWKREGTIAWFGVCSIQPWNCIDTWREKVAMGVDSGDYHYAADFCTIWSEIDTQADRVRHRIRSSPAQRKSFSTGTSSSFSKVASHHRVV